jgi:importin subunit beta-1
VLQQRWMMLPEAVRLPVKRAILSTLASDLREARGVAALVVSKIAAIEVPHNMWPELVELLLHNISTSPSKELRQSTFEALGYICEEVLVLRLTWDYR